MFCSLFVASALSSILLKSDSSIEVFKPAQTGHNRNSKNLSPARTMNMTLPGGALKAVGKLSLVQIQQIAGIAGVNQTVRSLNSAMHFDARSLISGSSYMTIQRSSVDPSLNTILFDSTAGGGVFLALNTKTGESQYLIDASVAVVGSATVSASLDQAFEQRTITAQTQHLCWFVSGGSGKHTFELWTSTPSFIILKGVEISEVK